MFTSALYFHDLEFTSLVFLSSSMFRARLNDFLGLSIFLVFLIWDSKPCNKCVNHLPNVTRFFFFFKVLAELHSIANNIGILYMWWGQLIKYDWINSLVASSNLYRRQTDDGFRIYNVIIQVAPSVELLSTQFAKMWWEQVIKCDWLESLVASSILNRRQLQTRNLSVASQAG